jgi:hypothetical protein
VTGTGSETWGTPVNAYSGGVRDAFVAKLDSSGSRVWNTFLGGVFSNDSGNGIAVDGNGNVYVAGSSTYTWGTPVNAFASPGSAFAAMLDPSGIRVWNTFLGPASGASIAVANTGFLYLGGMSSVTWGTPVNALAGGIDNMVSELDGSGVLQWNTFLGSTGDDYGASIAVDGIGNLYIAGTSYPSWGTPVNPHAGGDDAFAAKLHVTDVLDPEVDLSGTIQSPTGQDVCAMVLASGQYMFSCNPIGEFSLTNLPREKDGTVKRQIYADGFFPKIDILTDSGMSDVVMTRSGTCPNYNTFDDPAFVPGSAGKRIDISGKILLQDSQTPICAMALANGQYMFTCDGTGNYALNIPLDSNGQFKLQVYADGFAPITQKFDESSANNDVRMARAVECQ